MQYENAMSALGNAIGDRRVTPGFPSGRIGFFGADEEDAAPAERDATSSWTAHIRYVDVKGQESERRFTCHKIMGFGAATHVLGFCHERGALRTFKVGSIQELVCCETGEFFDAVPHFEQLRQTGALRVEDKVLTEVVRALAFLARCDGSYHPLERSAMEQHIERYCVRFDGTDAMARDAVAGCGRLAPDSIDFLKALSRIARSPERVRVARFVLDAGAAIVDADGRHDPEETRWAVEASNVLKIIAAR